MPKRSPADWFCATGINHADRFCGRMVQCSFFPPLLWLRSPDGAWTVSEERVDILRHLNKVGMLKLNMNFSVLHSLYTWNKIPVLNCQQVSVSMELCIMLSNQSLSIPLRKEGFETNYFPLIRSISAGEHFRWF